MIQKPHAPSQIRLSQPLECEALVGLDRGIHPGAGVRVISIQTHIRRSVMKIINKAIA